MRTHLPIVLFAVWASIHSVQAVDYVHLSEIMYDTPLPEVESSPPANNGEFIELYNAGAAPVDLSGWEIRGDRDGETIRFQTVTLAAHTCLIVCYRHKQSPAFELSQLFPDINPAHIVYHDNIILRNTKKYIRLFDAQGMKRDSIYYGSASEIPSAARLIAKNGEAIDGHYVSVQRIRPQFQLNGALTANHDDWEVAVATPLTLLVGYEEFDIPQQAVSYTYDATGNRTSRTIVLSSYSSRRQGKSKNTNVSPEEVQEPDSPLSDIINGTTINILPNPTAGHLSVEITNASGDTRTQAAVFNLNGERLLSRQSMENVIDIDLSACPPGTYILYLTINGKSRNYKIIKL